MRDGERSCNMATRRFALLVLCCFVFGDGQTASAQTVQPNPVSWFADFFDPIHGTGGSRGTFTFVDAVLGLPAGGVQLDGVVSPGDMTFIFQVTLHPESRALTTVGVQGADVTAAGWIPGSTPDSVGFSGAARAFNDVQIVLDGTLGAGQTSELFFVSFSAVSPGTVLAYWIVEEGAAARIFIGNVTVQDEDQPEPPREPLVLYDDFESGARINPEKWFGGGGARPVLDVRRAQAGGRLRLQNRSYAATDTNVGSQTGQVFVGFTNPSAVRAIQATLEVETFEVHACAGNSVPGRASAQIFGSFFNSAIRTPNSHVNDVAVALDVVRGTDSPDPKSTLQINAGVLVCATPDCSQADVIGAANLGPVLRGESVTLKVEWDPQNDRFIVQRGQRPEVSLFYTVPDSSPAGLANKILALNTTVPNCTAAPRPTGLVRISVEQVLVNQSAAK
jgi:hypothetical protein